MTVAEHRRGMPQGEQLVLCRDEDSGLEAAIAVDDTTLGPGLGGVRFVPYPSFDDAVAEASRLARVMTLKNALADIPYGGAKSVIVKHDGLDAEPARRSAQLRSFAAFVRDLDGAYIPGVDMGTSTEDLTLIKTMAPWVSCDHDDPSPATALGVFHSMAAAVRHVSGRDMTGVRVVIQGAGHVGSSLALLLHAHGAQVAVCDVDTERAARLSEQIGGTVVSPEGCHTAPCDVFAPCAGARVLHPDSIAELRCSLVVGAANDMLAARSCADLMERRGILYIPDFVSNAGGVVCIHAERARWDEHTLSSALEGIGRRTTELLDDSVSSSPLDTAELWASERLGHRVTVPD